MSLILPPSSPFSELAEHDEELFGLSPVQVHPTVKQWEVFNCTARHRVVVAGRRSGKTSLATMELQQTALEIPQLFRRPALCWYVAPTYKSAKRRMWRSLKRALAPYMVDKDESDLEIELFNGSIVALKGADNYDSLRGDGLDLLVMDEFADMKEAAWTLALRPTLSDKQGRALFLGTPKGFNWAYDRWQNAHTLEGWEAFRYTTAQGGLVPQSEIEAAMLDMNAKAFRQEYEASFETLTGRVFPDFDREVHTKHEVKDLNKEVLVGMDFNVNPMCAVLGTLAGNELHIFDEIVLLDSNTTEMATELKNRFHSRPVWIYPDPSGKARKTSAPVGQTDFSILEAHGFTVVAPPAHNLVKDRVNNTNNMIKSASGAVRLYVHPRCEYLIKSLYGLTYKEGTSIVNKADGLEHITDALGYLIDQVAPIVGNRIIVTKVRGT